MTVISDRLKYFENLQSNLQSVQKAPVSTPAAPLSSTAAEVQSPAIHRVSLIKEALLTGKPVPEEALSRKSSVREKVERINSVSIRPAGMSTRASTSQAPYQRSPMSPMHDETLVKPSQLNKRNSHSIVEAPRLSTAGRPAFASAHANAHAHGLNGPAAAVSAPVPVNKFGGGNHTCAVCKKTVYFMDQLQIDNNYIHKACLKCEHCKMTLKLGTFAAIDGKYYCKPHFKQLFKLKGNYFEGFGKDDIKKQWQ